MDKAFNPSKSTTKYLDLIRVIPCFSELSPAQLLELVNLMNEKEVTAGTVIVNENEIVDCIYFITSGEAEVSVGKKRYGSTKKEILALLHAGDAIGLNESGFYSTSGKRTATVTALTEVHLLRLEIQALLSFLNKFQLQNAMRQSATQMLRMQLIKQSLPFSKLSPTRLKWLAEHVEEVKLRQNEIIFQRGDKGDKCFLIKSGKVKIYTISAQGEEIIIAILQPPALFGEATLITSSPRNASAKTIEECELLILEKSHLTELLESENHIATMFMSLMIERSRPIQNPHVSAHPSKTAEGEVITILKEANTHTYFKLSAEGEFIWSKLDGKHTLEMITLDLAEQFNLFAPNLVAGLISKLNKAGFLTSLPSEELAAAQKHKSVNLWTKLKNLLVWRKAFGDADPIISRWYNNVITYLYTPFAQAIFIILSFSGFVLFVDYTPNILLFFNYHHASLLLIFALLPLSILETLLHELGHAFTVKAFGREVHYLGIGWNWVTPTIFTDTSDMWLASPRERILVNSAGVYVDILIAGLTAFLILVSDNPYVQALLWLYAMYTYIGAFRMLSPLQNLDGYYILMDWLGKPHLRKSAVRWLMHKLPQTFKHPRNVYHYLPEISYWIACLFYLILISLVTLILQTFVLMIFEIDSPSKYFSLLLPFLVVSLSSIAMILEIRREEKNE